jgi:hypothetical protein
MIELNIVPECYVDTKIAEIVSQAKRKYNHQHGCGDVSKLLQKQLKDKVALGIVDEDSDKGPVAKYFLEFNLVIKENNLVLKKHKTRNHYLILICPEVEKWLLEDAKSVGIDPSDSEYNLPDSLKEFIKISKEKDIDRNEGFKKFIKTLVREKAPSITTLKKWIELFKFGQLDTLSNK